MRFTMATLTMVVILGLAGCGQEPKKVALPPPEVTVVQPDDREVTRYLDSTGTTAALESVDIRARVQGFLDSIHFKPRAKVKAGDLLFVIDPRPYQAKVDQAGATLAARQAASTLADVEEKKAKQLQSKEAISELKWLEAIAQRDVARAQVDQASADLEAAKLDLDYTQVRSPINGHVSRNLVDVGNLVGATGKSLLTTVVNDESIYVYFNVSERDILPLIRQLTREDKKAREKDETAPAFMGLADEEGYPHKGSIDFADTKIDSSTGTMQIRAIFPNPDGLLLSGLFVRVRVPIETRKALLVPDVAVQADQAGKYLLVVNDKGIVERRNIKTGQVVDAMTVILQGLKAGERVIVKGLQRARPGAKVSPSPSAATPATVPAPKEKKSTP